MIPTHKKTPLGADHKITVCFEMNLVLTAAGVLKRKTAA
jgi:hypothetical protein